MWQRSVVWGREPVTGGKNAIRMQIVRTAPLFVDDAYKAYARMRYSPRNAVV